MDVNDRMALAKRLEAVETELQAAVAGLDGSLAARTRCARARAACRTAEQLALAVLGAYDALALAEAQQAAECELGVTAIAA